MLLNIFSPKFQVSHWCYLELYVPQVHSLVAQMVKHLPTTRETGFNPWVRKIPWRRKWQPTPVLLPGKSHGWRRLVGYSPWGHNESDTTERLHKSVHPFSISSLLKSLILLRSSILGDRLFSTPLRKQKQSEELYPKILTSCAHLAIPFLL